VSNETDFEIRWYNKLQVRISATLLVMILLVIFAIIAIYHTLGNSLIEKQAYLKLTDARHRVIAALEYRTIQATSLVNSTAKVATKLPDADIYSTELVQQLIDHSESKHVIAGGGVFFEPFELYANNKRAGLFWERDQQGELQLHDGYNSPAGAGYHNEEWYVPVKYLPPGKVYWSRSYTDPHSLQSMVTVSAPVYRQDRHIGVTTIDLKLDGIQELLDEVTHEFGGYAIIVDRNGHFLSFPNENLAKYTQNTANDGSLPPLLNISELAENLTDFKPLVALLYQQADSSQRLAPERTKEWLSLANKLVTESNQIEAPEAKKIAATLLGLASPAGNLDMNERHLTLTQDHFLKETVFISVSTMPETYWQVVTVMPESAAKQEVAELFNLLFAIIIIAVLVAMALISFFFRFNLAQPLVLLILQLKTSIQDEHQTNLSIETKNKGEIGALAYWFNLRSKQLLESQSQTKHLAFYDALTGLPNRRMLLDRLEQQLAETKRRGYTGAALYIDLDHFKNLNDSLGHSVGDELLIKVGNRLGSCLRENDCIARIGGDEFVIVIASENNNHNESGLQAARVANRIIDSFSSPFNLSGNHYHITASIGITLFPIDHQGVEEVLKQADTAMYQAKNNGRNNYCFFETEMQHRVDERLRIQEELRHAIDANDLRLHYQPQVDAKGNCRSVEALVRWEHPVDGQISPAAFIPIAEESTLILPLGRWVLFEACRQISQWNEQGITLHHVAVNVSARQFQQDDFINEVKSALEQFNLLPQQLMLEITEGVILENTQEAIEKMNALKALGLSISMDDFGTGYSSLAYLKQLPLDQLKIDQSFVRDITTESNDAVLVETIISMAKHLGFDVIAEGVETEEQQQLLCEKGCFHYQGYYFSRPLTADGFAIYMGRGDLIEIPTFQSSSRL